MDAEKTGKIKTKKIFESKDAKSFELEHNLELKFFIFLESQRNWKHFWLLGKMKKENKKKKEKKKLNILHSFDLFQEELRFFDLCGFLFKTRGSNDYFTL